MKNITNKIFVLIIVISSLFASCEFLEIEPLDSYTENSVFSDLALTEAYVTRNYILPVNGFNSTALRFVSDESHNNFNWGGAWTITRGQMTPDQFGSFGIWNSYYGYIRACNVFFNNVDKLPGSEDEKNRLIGEMTFFRAYYYMELINRYGGVPLITTTFELDDEDMMIPRDSYDACVDFVVSEFSKAATLLPERWTGSNFGRATKGAALAMKSRVLLYAASPLWNTTNSISKWQAAADAAKEVMNLGVYQLDSDYKGLFINSNSPEIIFQRLYTNEYSNNYDWQNTPNGWTGYSATCVTQSMVDSYEMTDGSMPDVSMYAEATNNPWAGREPRFYASVVYDGQIFRDDEVEFWINEDGKTGGKDSEFGTDNWNHSKTHYTIRKFMDESLKAPWTDKGGQPWIYSRYAEILLNYAEAMFHVGDEEEARRYINLVRERARNGANDVLPDITASGDGLLKAIQHERKIELAFEEHRFFDVRRWKIAEITENIDVHGIKIVKKADGTKSYTIVKVDDRVFISPKHYLFPIPNDEIRKNNLLEQNPSYDKIQ
ncbi:MAG: RagB/SusD family nutrient uptake outer membrane protein [Candidatus Paceibacterota bacterium]|jgi:hypothetical protein|nr:RagB/SusD family nutrient uptake outer membrane protein [Clostridia bacterium]MDD3093279.1 RagB/SusD family nutrient uptake outer membrane protein [Clostridia bacterium]MDD3971555.1 RagB/SusD family nutrient uptake outer membrane protein [Clostridia bacterium]